VTAIMAELTDPDIPSANKGDVVTPPFTDEQARKTDFALNFYRGRGTLPFNFIVSDIQPAPNNMAGATVENGATCRAASQPLRLTPHPAVNSLCSHLTINSKTQPTSTTSSMSLPRTSGLGPTDAASAATAATDLASGVDGSSFAELLSSF
jgi:hypothetical protein